MTEAAKRSCRAELGIERPPKTIPAQPGAGDDARRDDEALIEPERHGHRDHRGQVSRWQMFLARSEVR